MKATIKVMLKEAILDPQGKAIEGALAALGFSGIESVRQGKYFEIIVHETSEEKAKKLIEDICEKLIANQTIETYEIGFK